MLGIGRIGRAGVAERMTLAMYQREPIRLGGA